MAGTFDMGQYLSILPFLVGVYGLFWSFKRRIPAGWYEEVYEDEARPRKARDRDVEEVLNAAKRKKKGKKRKKKAASVQAPAAREDSNDTPSSVPAPAPAAEDELTSNELKPSSK
jgi:hypothetical protein